MTITNDKKTDTAIDNAEKSLKNFDGAVEHVRRTTTRNLIKVTSALDDITATLKSIKDSSEAVDYIDRVKPTRERLQRTKESLEKLLRSCKDYGNAVQTGDDNKADQAVDGMKDELKSLASISPEMAAELKALQAAYDELKTIVDRLVINDEKQDARLDHIEAYLEAATAGNGFTPYVRYGATPATPEQPTSVPTSTTPLPAASQDQPSITDVQSLRRHGCNVRGAGAQGPACHVP